MYLQVHWTIFKKMAEFHKKWLLIYTYQKKNAKILS